MSVAAKTCQLDVSSGENVPNEHAKSFRVVRCCATPQTSWCAAAPYRDAQNCVRLVNVKIRVAVAQTRDVLTGGELDVNVTAA